MGKLRSQLDKMLIDNKPKKKSYLQKVFTAQQMALSLCIWVVYILIMFMLGQSNLENLIAFAVGAFGIAPFINYHFGLTADK